MSKTTAVLVPHESVNDESVLLVSWLVENGEQVDEGQHLASIETSKAVMHVDAPLAGFVKLLFKPGDEIPVGSVLCYIHEELDFTIDELNETRQISQDDLSDVSRIQEPDQSAQLKNGSLQPQGSPQMHTDLLKGQASEEVPPGAVRFSKRALEVANQHGLSIQQFAGKGLVRVVDVLNTVGKSNPSPNLQEKPAAKHSRADVSSSEIEVPFRTEQLPRRKRSEIHRLEWSRQNTLMSSVSLAAPSPGLKAAARLHPEIQGNTTAIVAFEVARLLRKYPNFNAFHSNGHANFYEEVNIGIAVDADHGLKVLVIRNADTKTLIQLVAEMRELLVSYLNDELTVESVRGGTFTITDLSADGVFTFSPLIHQHQSAILGLGSEFFPLASTQGLFNLILAFDHQLSEGRQAAHFLNDLRDRLRSYEEALNAMNRTDEDREEPYCSKCLKTVSELQEWNQSLMIRLQPNGKMRNVCTVCLQGV